MSEANADTGQAFKQGSEHLLQGFGGGFGSSIFLLKDKAPRNDTNKPALSWTSNFIGDSWDLCVLNAHL